MFRAIGKLAWVVSAVVVIIDFPVGPTRMGIVPAWAFYAALAVCVLRFLPLLRELWRGRRNGGLFGPDRAGRLNRELDDPAFSQPSADAERQPK